VHFTNPVADIIKAHTCRECSSSYASKNELFRHLRREWSQPSKHQVAKSYALMQPTADASGQPVDEEPKPIVEDIAEANIANVAESNVNDAQPRISIQSTARFSGRPGYAFRGFHYVTLGIMIATELVKACVDTGCSMTLIDRALLQRLLPDLKLSRLSSPISVRGLGDAMHQSSEYARISITIDGTLDEKLATSILTMEVHIVDNLRANLLIGNDVIVPERMKLDPASQRMTIGSCQDMVTHINAVAKDTPVQRSIRSRKTVTIPAMSTVAIPISCQGKSLPTNRDFLFEPSFKGDLGFDGGVFAHIIDSSMSHIHLHNASEKSTTIPRRTRLRNVIEYDQAGAYIVEQVDSRNAPLAASSWLTRRPRQSWKSKLTKSFAAVATAVAITATSVVSKPSATTSSADLAQGLVVIDPALKHVLGNGITVYGHHEEASQIANLAYEFADIFTD